MQPFGYGPKSCIGQIMGRLESKVILARLVWNFDMQLMPESRSWLDAMPNFTIWQKPPLMVRLSPAQAAK